MFKVEYFHGDTGASDFFSKVSKSDALKMFDGIIAKVDAPVKRVSSRCVEFRNGDYVRLFELGPLSAIMLTKEDRGYYNDGSDSIFDDED